MTTPDDEQPENRRTRATTKLEITLGLGLIGQFAAAVWFAATLNATVSQMQGAMADIARSVGVMQSEAPRNAVLEYRLTKAEEEIRALKAARR
jgi:hypothetical protein